MTAPTGARQDALLRGAFERVHGRPLNWTDPYPDTDAAVCAEADRWWAVEVAYREDLTRRAGAQSTVWPRVRGWASKAALADDAARAGRVA